MSSRLFLTFEQTPKWYTKKKLMFLFDRNACRLVADLEYLVRKKFGMDCLCNLYLDGFLLPSQENIDVVRDGDTLRVENVAVENSDIHEKQSSPKKRKKSEMKSSAATLAKSINGSENTKSSHKRHKNNMMATASTSATTSSSDDDSASASSTSSSSADKTKNVNTKEQESKKSHAKVGAKHQKENNTKKSSPLVENSTSSSSSSSELSSDSSSSSTAYVPNVNHYSTNESLREKSSLSQINSKTVSTTAPSTKSINENGHASTLSRSKQAEKSNALCCSTLPKTRSIAIRPLNSNANHIHFDSDEEECIPVETQQFLVTANGNEAEAYHSCESLLASQENIPVYPQCSAQAPQEPSRNGGDFETRKTVDYSALPPLCGPPRSGDRIAYKILEISASYTPEISEYKEGVVCGYNPTSDEVLVELTPESLVKPLGDGNVSNKFELISGDEDEEEFNKPQPLLDRKVTVSWSTMISPKLMNS